MRGELTRELIFEFIVTYITKHGYSPTVREIGEAVGLKSTSSVQSQLKRMYVDGTIETDTELRSPRAIRVPGYRFMKFDE